MHRVSDRNAYRPSTSGCKYRRALNARSPVALDATKWITTIAAHSGQKNSYAGGETNDGRPLEPRH